MIKRSIALALLLTCTTASATVPAPAVALEPLPEHSVSIQWINTLLKEVHYKEVKLNDAQSELIFDKYLETLDPNRSLFTQSDIDSFTRYKFSLDDEMEEGNMDPAFEIFDLANQRRVERADYALSLLDYPFDFTLDEEYVFDRKDAPWAKDSKELDDIWRKRVKNDVLSLTLAGKDEAKLKETLTKRYQRIKTRVNQFKPEDAYELFVNAYLRTIEPHTSYFSPRNSENFKIDMSLSLEGIGAVLQTVDDYTVVKRIVTGGPADLSGQLHPEDKITGVAQGKEGELEDVIGWRIDDVVDLIRGPKDSIVRLQVVSKSDGVDIPPKILTIVRDKIKLEEQQAQKSVIEIPNGDKTARVGVIDIPTFYMDFDAASRGDDDYVSTTRDTRQLIEELKKENVEGIIIDLRGNGGGSLSEAISLSGLFIKSGPVVQVHNYNDSLKVNSDTDKSIAYDGPLAVLVDRFSASASEIFAGAMQDYGRATIIGEPTFGKGTVQQILDLNRFARRQDHNLGQVKMTMAQFFRVNGDSTQNRGVVPDIIFPTADIGDDSGERALDFALPWAHIKAAKYTPFNAASIDLSLVKARHQQRIASDSGFEYLLEQSKVRQTAMDKTSISLKKETRKTEREKQETENLARLNRFRTSIGLKPQKKEDLNDDEEESVVVSEEDENFAEQVKRIQAKEAAAILLDIINAPKHSEKLIVKEAQSNTRI